MSHLGAITLVVRTYDDAIDFYTKSLGFDLIEDTDLGAGKRWVLIAPPQSGPASTRLLLAEAKNDSELAAAGQQTGGRVSFFLHTDDFARDYADFSARGVQFLEAPRHEAYGTVAVFVDLYGNKWDLLELNKPSLP